MPFLDDKHVHNTVILDNKEKYAFMESKYHNQQLLLLSPIIGSHIIRQDTIHLFSVKISSHFVP